MRTIVRTIRHQWIGVIALLMVSGALASAATGGNFLLGKSNTADKPTVLTNSATGATLDLRAKAGQPALKVNSNKLVSKLNADLLDGKSSSAFAAEGSSYTKAESDGKYPLATNTYTKAQSDGKYPLVTNVYTKAQADANFVAAAAVYSKTAADARFGRALLGGTGSLTSANDSDEKTLFDQTVAAPAAGVLLINVEIFKDSGSSAFFKIYVDGNLRSTAGNALTGGSFTSSGVVFAAAGSKQIKVTMTSQDASSATGHGNYSLVFVPNP